MNKVERAGYKGTESILVPSDWLSYPIKDVSKTTSGGTPLRSNNDYYESGTIPWVKTGELKNKYIYNTEEKITEKAIKETSAKLIPKNTVVVAMYGATIGRMSITKSEVATNQACCAIIPKKGELDYEYLYYTLLFNKNRLISLGAGGAQPNISQQIIRDYFLLIPPILQQQKIKTILTSVDNAIEKTEEIIVQTEKVKKGLMQQLLTKGIGHTKFKKTEIGEIPEGWEVIRIGDITNKITKGTTPSTYGFEYTDEGINFIKIESIDNNGAFIPNNFSKISEEAHKKLLRSQFVEGDILISIAGALGRVAVVTADILPANTNQAIAIVRLHNKTLQNFLFYALRGYVIEKYINKVATIGAQPNLSLKQISDLKVAMPSEEEQYKIVNILKSIDVKHIKEQQKLEVLRLLKKGLMQVLLTGNVRVKVDKEEVTTS